MDLSIHSPIHFPGVVLSTETTSPYMYICNSLLMSIITVNKEASIFSIGLHFCFHANDGTNWREKFVVVFINHPVFLKQRTSRITEHHFPFQHYPYFLTCGSKSRDVPMSFVIPSTDRPALLLVQGTVLQSESYQLGWDSV
jgi:hypothetical protein